jgi:hypothetical protein
MHTEVWSEKLKERTRLEDLDVDGDNKMDVLLSTVLRGIS